MDTPPIRVVADDRERGSGVIATLRVLGNTEVGVERLTLGDYVIAASNLVFERKTLLDLVASIKDQRLFMQACRLARKAERPVIVLEGTGRDLQDTRMRRESIQGALISLSLVLGIPVLRSMNPKETAQLMVCAARQMQTAATGAYPRGGYRPKGKKRTQHHILQGLPGIGCDRAKSLLENFETVESVMNADEKDLAAVHGIGKITARKIRWALNESPGSYNISPFPDGISRKS